MLNLDGYLGGRCVQEALHIGSRLASRARWSGSRCTWDVVSADRGSPVADRPVYVLAGPTLYQGTSGIALFLTELAGVTGQSEFLRCARGGLAHAIAELDGMGTPAFGLHTGRVGVAYALTRFASVTGDDWAAVRAECALRPLLGAEARDRGLDVISGAAGAIPVLLQIADTLSLSAARTSAISLGNHLVRVANRRPEGWSWGTRSLARVRDLCGLAHGAAGCAAGLLELWAATGDVTYRYAASQGFSYETHHFDSAAGNWPDYRDREWTELLLDPEKLSLMRQALRDGAFPPEYTPVMMNAWCHGAPGIGLTRLRAYALLSEQRYLDDARAAVASTRVALRDRMGNYSLCHGMFGNCETILCGARHLDEPSWLGEVEEWIGHGLQRYGGNKHGWPSGALLTAPDNSLLLGDAGVGHFLLRAARPDVPSILLPTSESTPRRVVEASEREREQEQALRDADVAIYFPRTLNVFARLGVDPAVLHDLGGSAAPAAPVLSAAAAIQRAAVQAQPTAPGALLLDAARLELTVVDLLRTQPSASEEYADAIQRLPPDELRWDSVVFALSRTTRLVRSAYDWDRWLARMDHTASATLPECVPPNSVDAACTYAVFLRDGGWHVQRLGALADVVLGVIERWSRSEAATVDAVTVVALADGHIRAPFTQLRERVSEQLRQGYISGLLCVSREPDLGPATSSIRTDIRSVGTPER